MKIGDRVKVNGKEGVVSWLHDYTVYNGVAKGERTSGTVRFEDGSEATVNDMYGSKVEVIKKGAKNA